MGRVVPPPGRAHDPSTRADAPRAVNLAGRCRGRRPLHTREPRRRRTHYARAWPSQLARLSKHRRAALKRGLLGVARTQRRLPEGKVLCLFRDKRGLRGPRRVIPAPERNPAFSGRPQPLPASTDKSIGETGLIWLRSLGFGGFAAVLQPVCTPSARRESPRCTLDAHPTARTWRDPRPPGPEPARSGVAGCSRPMSAGFRCV
jgi:hypothetical protein